MPTVSGESQDPGQAAAIDTTNTFVTTTSPPLLPTPYGVRGWRCLRLGLHFVWGGLVTAAIYPWVNEAKRLQIKQRGSRRTLELLSIRIDALPVDIPPGCLIVANHIRWLDIFAINALHPAAFIARSEVRHWPFIGWLSARNDTLFLHRSRHTHARKTNREIAARLRHKADIAVFPEGTTSDETLLHGFHAALLHRLLTPVGRCCRWHWTIATRAKTLARRPLTPEKLRSYSAFRRFWPAARSLAGPGPHRRSFRSASRGARWPMPHMQPSPGNSAFNDERAHYALCDLRASMPGQRTNQPQ